MKRGWVAQALAWSSLVPLVASAGCDALTVRSFAGSVMQFTVAGADKSAAGHHLELWARDQYNDIIRIDPYYDLTAGKTAYGLMVRQAISLDDPCMIDDKGNLLTTAAAYPSSVVVGDVTQTPEEQAKQVIDRISQLQKSSSNGQPLLAVVPYDDHVPPAVPKTASAAERLAACAQYRNASDLTYIANPYQITAPLHGAVYGFLSYVTTVPPTNYDGFRLDVPIGLKGLQELFFTDETASVDPNHRGPLFLVSQQTLGGREALHFDLTSPSGTASGTASVYVNLDEDPVQF